MPKTKRRKKPIQPGMEPTPEQLANDEFNRDFVTHAETATKAMAYRREGSIVERWIAREQKQLQDGEIAPDDLLFPQHAQIFMGDCLNLWARCGEPRLIAEYGERIASGRVSDGMGRKEALDTLHRWRDLLGPYSKHFWACYENVLRHNEPAGVAGSSYAKNDAQRIQSAKVITGMVATTLAGKLGY